LCFQSRMRRCILEDAAGIVTLEDFPALRDIVSSIDG